MSKIEETYDGEIWVEAYEFPNYEVSNLGRVRNARTEKVLKIGHDASAYNMVRLYYGKKKYTRRLGRLIWASFNNCACKHTIDHKDKNALNDKLDNLHCIPLEDQYKNRKNKQEQKKHNISNETKKKIQTQFDEGMNYWQLSKLHKIPYNYIRTTMIRGSWKKYL